MRPLRLYRTWWGKERVARTAATAELASALVLRAQHWSLRLGNLAWRRMSRRAAALLGPAPVRTRGRGVTLEWKIIHRHTASLFT